MKSLKIIQTLFMIARVLALIVFILSIVGAAGCLIGIIVLSVMKDLPIIEGKTLAEELAAKGVDIIAVIIGVVFGMVGCGVSIFLAKYSELFFLKEIKAGTPFTKAFAKEMRIFGIIYIAVSIGATAVMGMTYGITAHFYPQLKGYDFSFHVGSIFFGLFMIILSVFCDYGAEVGGETPKVDNPDVIDNEEVK